MNDLKKYKSLLLIIICLSFSIRASTQSKLIFDTDFGGDADDLGALAMLHNFVDKGECELLSIMCWSVEEYAVPAIDAINHFYKHPNIPIGARKDSTEHVEWNYSKPIADKFPHELTHESVIDATVLYRQILAKSDDKSITIITVGPLKNIQNLILSKGDSISSLTGIELIEKKVKEFVVMGGKYPSGKWEWNFNGNMSGVTKFVIENLQQIPIVFSGFEVGVGIRSGEIFNNIDHHTPLYVGFMHFSNNAPWMKEFYTGKIIDNATFDQTAVLYAIRNGVGTYWDKIKDEACVPDNDGGNKWIKKENSNHSYLKLLMKNEEMATLIESFMLNKF